MYQTAMELLFLWMSLWKWHLGIAYTIAVLLRTGYLHRRNQSKGQWLVDSLIEAALFPIYMLLQIGSNMAQQAEEKSAGGNTSKLLPVLFLLFLVGCVESRQEYPYDTIPVKVFKYNTDSEQWEPLGEDDPVKLEIHVNQEEE